MTTCQLKMTYCGPDEDPSTHTMDFATRDAAIAHLHRQAMECWSEDVGEVCHTEKWQVGRLGYAACNGKKNR